MADEVDDLLRRTMKTLDDQVPSGYFEALPNRTLQRLEASMQSGVDESWSTESGASSGVPPMKDEDSGLHDIRNLAQSTKQRLSNKRVTTNPPMSDEDVLATSSAGWKAVALPQPAKMVSLPALDELPPAKQVKAADQAARVAAAPPVERFKRVQPKRGRGGLYAMIGLTVAAAAGVTLYVMTQRDKSAGSELAINAPAAPPIAKPQVVAAAPTPPPPAPVTPADDEKTAAPATGALQIADEPKPAPAPAKGHASTKKPPVVVIKDDRPAKVEVKKPDAPAKKVGQGETDPSFDDLLKEAGVDQKHKADKPKLDKKSLSGDDFKHGMAAVAAKAAACYKGTQGTAAVKLTVAPSGQVSKASVGGAFAGKPEADCVANAVKSASFPPWDGGPQSFNYSYLLSE